MTIQQDHQELLARLQELEEKLDKCIDLPLLAETPRPSNIDPGALSQTFTKAGLLVESIVRQLFEFEFPGKRAGTFDSISTELYNKGVLDKGIARKIDYIRLRRNDFTHAHSTDTKKVNLGQDDVHEILGMTYYVVNWYIYDYLPSEQTIECTSAAPPPPTDCPYQGLAPFESHQADFFFGRSTETADLVQQVTHKPLIALIGNSGSGKSSLVMAGLIPRLAKKKDWLILTCRPKNDPFLELSQTLCKQLYDDPVARQEKTALLSDTIKEGSVSLEQMITGEVLRKQNKKQCLLIIDQFEELYSLTSDKKSQEQFIRILLAHLSDPSPAASLTILFTLRADFLGTALEDEKMATALNAYPPRYVQPLTQEALRQIIEEPAKKMGVTCEPLLVDRIIRDLSANNETVSLPLLEFTLEQTWCKLNTTELSHLAYEKTGGVMQSLVNHADEALTYFIDNGQLERVRHVLMELIRPGDSREGGLATRQIAHRSSFSDDDWQIINHLASKRLVITGRPEDGAEQETVELIHEALIHHWQQLKTWIEEDREFRLWQEELRTSLRQWEEADKEDAALLQGVRLAEAEEKEKQYHNRISKPEHNFIKAGTTLRAKRKKQRTQLIIGSFSLMTMVLLVISGLWWQSAKNAREAEKQRSEALTQQKIAEQKTEEADKQLIEANHNFGLALLEKAKAATEKKEWNNAALYARHALDKLRDNDFEGRAKAGGVIGSSPLTRALRISADLLEGDIKCISFSPNGEMLATVAKENVVIWDLTKETAMYGFRIHSSPIFSIVFSTDNNTLVLGLGDNDIVLWDIVNAKPLTTLKGHSAAVLSIAISPDGKMLASGGKDHKVIIWDIDKRKPLTIIKEHESVHSVTFSPDGKMLAYGTADGKVVLWDIDNAKPLTTHIGLLSAVLSVAFSPDGTTLACGSFNHNIYILDITSNKIKISALLTRHSAPVSSVTFSPDGSKLVSGGWDNSIIVYNANMNVLGQQYTHEATIEGSSSLVNSIAFSPDGKLLASGSDDNEVILWHMATSNPLTLIEEHESVYSVTFSPDDKMLAYGTTDGDVALWDIDNAKPLTTLKGHSAAVFSVVFSPDGKMLASGGKDHKVIIWDIDKRKPLTIIKEHESVYSVTFSPDGKMLAYGTTDGDVALWDIDNAKPLTTLKGHSAAVFSVVFSPDGKMLASGGKDHTIILWDIESARILTTLNDHSAPVVSVTFSPDGKTLATGAADGNVIIWDIDSSNPLTTLTAQKAIWSISFSPDGKMLASGTSEKNIIIWDVETGKPLFFLNGHSLLFFDVNPYKSVAFSLDGKTLVSGAADGSVCLWDIARLKKLNQQPVSMLEQSLQMHLVGLNLQPMLPPVNLYNTAQSPPAWPKSHPFHWLARAEAGDSEAMLQLGIIYHRDNKYQQAKHWYEKAKEAGHPQAEERLDILEKTR